MPVDYTTQIKPLEDAGETDAAIIEEIKWRHVRDIMANGRGGN